jgi:integrase
MSTWDETIIRYGANELLHRRPRGVTSYQRVLRRLAAFAPEWPPTAPGVADYMATRNHLVATTIAFEMTVISSFQSWAVRRGMLGGDDVLALVTRPRVSARPPIQASRATIDAVADWINQPATLPRSARFVALCLYAGLRFDEARRIVWADVDAETGELIVRDGKGGKFRPVWINITLARVLGRAPLADRCGAIAGHPDGRPLSIGGGQHIFDRELKQAGIDVSAHMLRRAFATELDRKGESLRIIQELLGHSSLATTARYIGVDHDRKQAAVAKLDGAFGGG